MELEFDDNLLLDEEQPQLLFSAAQLATHNRKSNKPEDENSADQQLKVEKETAETLASIIMHTYDNKLYGEDDTSQPTSRTAPMIPADPMRKKKKRKRSQISICLTNCRYESIRRVAGAFGMREVPEEEAWNFYWTDMSVSVERAKEMKRFQRINHFPGMLEICRKDLLARNLNRMQKIYPKDYNFFPKTWCLPADFGEAMSYSKLHKNKTFIIKPECGSQGRGIYLTKSLKDMKPTDKLICQVYLAKPYLLDGYKFDIRVYTLITSCDPLRIFVFNEGLVRFATSRYADPTLNNTTNVFMHLTNYALNKHSRTYVYDSEAGSKRCMLVLKFLVLMCCWITKCTHTFWRFADFMPTEYREQEKSPWQTQIQWEETHLGNFRRVYPVGEQYATLFQQPSGSLYTGTICSRARGDCTRIQREEFQQLKAKSEALKKPSQPKPKEGEKKEESGTTAITTVDKDKAAATKPKGKKKEQKGKEKEKDKEKEEKDNTKPSKAATEQPPVIEKVPKPRYVLCSYEPDPIVEKEERERVNLLAQRDFLIRSYGMLEQIYLVMKKMGTLRPEDERKYGVYGRLSISSSTPKKA